SIAVGTLRPCQPSTYWVHYCNNGAMTATGASVVVTIDPALIVTNSTIPWTVIGGNTYSFDLGDLSPEECGSFTIDVVVPCSDPVGTTYCAEAHAYPDTGCAPNNANWDGSQIEVTASCIGDSVVFTIHNIGLGAMQNPLNYIVIEDNILVMQVPGQFQLGPNESISAAFPANGSFLRIEAQQSPGFAGLSTPVAWAEGCNGSGNFSLGFVNQYPLGDEDPWLDVFCLESGNSYDPNDKNGFPRGVDAAHYIGQNVEMEYLVRFQNTGTAPALQIEIRDTLPAQLDPSTVRPGASSHAYTWDMQGNGVVVFKFADVNLPDSAASQLLSQGFVQFRVQQKKDVALGSQILNTAAIYFDNNAPVITNQTLHTVGKDFLVTSSTATPFLSNVRVQISPNPVTNLARVRVEGLENVEKLTFTLYSAMGKSLLSGLFTGTSYEFEAALLPSGVYFYEVHNGGKTVGKGKLVKM
ncbi:MAG: T9SS type A sorting domain-containing protein, partial [Saprospiraceae bacterium]